MRAYKADGAEQIKGLIMKRIAIFSHYDKHDIIDDYVVYFLTQLKKVCDEIIFVTDTNISVKDCVKIDGLVKNKIIGRHGEYDFGSYKRGFLSIQDPEEFDEIIFCNDSCYGPLYPITEMFYEMVNRSCDFWGATQNYFGYKREEISRYKLVKNQAHIQSYFFVLRKKVFTSTQFVDFIKSVKKETDKRDVIINYEIALTKLLSRNFSYDSYIPLSKSNPDVTLFSWKSLILKQRFPFLKIRTAKISTNVPEVLRNSDFPYHLVGMHLRRVKTKKDRRNKIFRLHRRAIRICGRCVIFFKK